MDAFNLGSMLIQVVNLAIVLFVLKKFLFKPYLALVEKTEKDQAEIASVHETVAKIRKDAEAEATSLVSDAHKKAFDMREHAAKNAQKNADDIVDQAEDQARIIRERAEGEIVALEQQFAKRMKDGVMTAAVELNKKLLGSSNTSRKDFMKAHLDEVVK
ncbi:ATP synthase F0 subunit B [Candidatus Gracilibacteria bacterium]|nr:ATP synthase F0 subunit B [Candidatus Gracilibacteria bacterium]